MSLYQKHRPHIFADVFAQDETIKYLQNITQLCKDSKDFPHAYIFSGTHGIGKTTLARIFAKELGVNNEDILELDAASTSRKIEDMRSLIDSTHNLPLYSKYKVYILDEAHALTKEASTALLKTLEEPFPHNIFMLCTTDADKVLPTIKSRCVQLQLKSPNLELIKEYIKIISKKEGIDLSENEMNILSVHSNNSYRDAIVNLEKFYHNDKSVNIFGETNINEYIKIISLLAKKDIKSLMEAILDMNNFNYKLFLDIIRQGMLVRQGVTEISILSKLEIEIINNIVKDKEIAIFFSSKYLLHFLEKYDLYRTSGDKKTALVAIFGILLEV
ncbi:MAG: AAA family ATPase [Cyanobium sp. MAG06]|nr:AAA family ATPase [Cyanobium sp. MAG06]